jgi:hypothetical protein
MDCIEIIAGSTTYFISDHNVPAREQLPWREEECDAFIAILDPEGLTDEKAREACLGLIRLRTDWIETMGNRAEFFHDLIDNTSVAIGRQSRIGDGDPMTAWHDHFPGLAEMIDYVKLGGHGASENKLIVVIGPDFAAALFAERLRAENSKA